jgi:hypothetical protein
MDNINSLSLSQAIEWDDESAVQQIVDGGVIDITINKRRHEMILFSKTKLEDLNINRRDCLSANAIALKWHFRSRLCLQYSKRTIKRRNSVFELLAMR